MRNWFKKNESSIILVMIFLVGLSLLLYPSFSEFWNSKYQSQAIASYTEKVLEIDDNSYELMIQAANEYNKKLENGSGRWIPSEEEVKAYNDLLNVSGTGIMGYVEIPNLRISLPIYHGVDEAVLQIAIGHIQGSSLPVGGEGTHCAISGHRGLPSAKLFTNIDELKEGDVFLLCILDEVLTYEVDQIRIVEPNDLSALEIEEGKDLCTLITCTPYGVNSHRLLVRGHRIETVKSNYIRVSADAMQMDETIVASFVSVPILLLLLIWLLIHYRKRR
ncbi:MAG: class C sortase [Schaedlerella sp.]|nr:class C sortase [Schaedlerella sp.]